MKPVISQIFMLICVLDNEKGTENENCIIYTN